MTFRPCVVIPTYNNPNTLDVVARAARAHLQTVVVDDGSGPEAVAVAQLLAQTTDVHVHFLPANGGKGAAVCAGFEVARKLGFTHAVQIDADGQHDTADIPRFLEAGARSPDALVLGQPIFDESAPRSRVMGRKVSVFWVAVETLSRSIGDPLCGFRLYPIEAALRAGATGRGMDFDPEVAVRLVLDGVRVIHVPVRVRYFSAAQGGVSSFRPWLDTLRISWMHTRMCCLGLLRLVTRRRF